MIEKFNFSTIEDFDKHISNSILAYDILYDMIINIIGFNANINSIIFDLGCTSGKLVDKIRELYTKNCYGYDICDKHFGDRSYLLKKDITDYNFILDKCDVVTSIFTLQFIEIEHRSVLLKKIYNSLKDKGFFILCEKEVALNSNIQEIFIFSNFDNKIKKFNSDEILEKERKLRGYMRCLTNIENISLLKNAGFEIIEPFFQSLNFKGYLCIK